MNLRTTKGFTLIEVVIVMLIIALFVAIAVPQYFSYLDKARINSAQVNIQALESVADAYYSDNGNYPENTAELVAQLKNNIVRPPSKGWEMNYDANTGRVSFSTLEVPLKLKGIEVKLITATIPAITNGTN